MVPSDPHVDGEQARRSPAEPTVLEAFHGEGLHHPKARDGLLENLGDVPPATHRGLVGCPQLPAELDQRMIDDGHSEECHEREAPVHVDENGHEPNDGEALLEDVTGHLRDGLLDALHVGRDVAHQRARGVSRQEREGLLQNVLIEGVPEVRDDFLAHLGHEGGREVRAEPLDEVERHDGERDPEHVHLMDEDLVGDRLDRRQEERRRCRDSPRWRTKPPRGVPCRGACRRTDASLPRRRDGLRVAPPRPLKPRRGGASARASPRPMSKGSGPSGR